MLLDMMMYPVIFYSTLILLFSRACDALGRWYYLDYRCTYMLASTAVWHFAPWCEIMSSNQRRSIALILPVWISTTCNVLHDTRSMHAPKIIVTYIINCVHACARAMVHDVLTDCIAKRMSQVGSIRSSAHITGLPNRKLCSALSCSIYFWNFRFRQSHHRNETRKKNGIGRVLCPWCIVVIPWSKSATFGSRRLPDGSTAAGDPLGYGRISSCFLGVC